MDKNKIIIGLSGGVDSSVAAFLLREQGYEVKGCFMRSFDTETSKRECELAERLASRIGISFEVADGREDFLSEVVEYFLRSYMEGRTPNPCCICNRTVKWPTLMKAMKKAGADKLATGHYAGVGFDEHSGRYYIQRAERIKKDQSYALYRLSQEELSHTVMPLFSYYKEDVRELARRIGLDTADKPDSQEICFIEDGKYQSFIMEHLDMLIPADISGTEREQMLSGLRERVERKGSFVDVNGRFLGEHEGIINYTIGQRKGLGIALGKRAFVKEIRPGSCEVVLSGDEGLYAREALVSDLSFQLLAIDDNPGLSSPEGIEATVKIRYGDRGMKARISFTDEERNNIRIHFQEPVRAVTPGQAAVFYDDEGRILGGGTIL